MKTITTIEQSEHMTATYQRFGEGAPLVLLHAFPLNQSMWQPQIAVLGHQYTVIAIDYAGFGRSTWEPGGTPGAHDIDDVAQSITAVLDELDIERAAVAGLSMGGYVALALWRIAPQRVDRLALCNSRASADDEATKQARSRNAAMVLEQGAEALADAMLPRLLSQHAGTGMRRHVHTLAASAQPRVSANALLMMRERPDATPLLPQITVPTLVVGASDDPIIPAHESLQMATALPNGNAVIIAESGHLSNLERPDVFNRALRDWMRMP